MSHPTISFAARPLIPSKPRLRFIDDAPDGGAGGDNKPETGETVADLKKALADAQAEIEKQKGHSRTWETRSKENADKAKKFDEFEEASKSEQQKLQDRVAAAEKALADRDSKDKAAETAKEVAKAKGITDASVLRGSTQEELEAHADQLLALLPKTAPTTTADGQGSTQTISEGEQSAEDVVKAARGK
jgi:hypothetical protein